MTEPEGAGLRDLDELRTFVQIVDSGSMTAAGRVLGQTTNVISRRLARLEERLGVPLAQRTTRRLQPTEEGRRLYVRARRILDEVANAEAEIRGVAEELTGELRLSVPTLAARQLRGSLTSFLEDHPGVDLRLFVTDRPSSAVLSDIAEQGLDAAVLIGPVPPSSVVTRLLSRGHAIFAAAPAYIEARGTPKKPRDLSDHECLCYIGDRVQTEWSVFDSKGRETVVPVRGRFASSDSRVLANALLDGQGIGLTSSHALEDDQLQRVLPKYQGPTFDVRLGYAASRRGSRRIEALATLLEAARDKR
ncbi:MAG: LysR family transcriptional regulator [Deltaproteobacteria bacterium]|nr:LysR family transcriptional regulator [Deltaproteobacteria bacterium]